MVQRMVLWIYDSFRMVQREHDILKKSSKEVVPYKPTLIKVGLVSYLIPC
jgi:hypothetical protein